jgi:hypothetical protein
MRGLSDHKTLSYFTRYHLVPEEELSKIKGSDESNDGHLYRHH